MLRYDDCKHFPALLADIRAGKHIPPHLEEVDLSDGVASISAGGGLVSYDRIDNVTISNSGRLLT